MKTIIFDIETTGFPERKGFDMYYDPSNLAKYKNSRVVQLAYIIVDNQTNRQTSKNFIIIPTDFKIENENIHGISHEKALKEGHPLSNVLKIFSKDLRNCRRIVAHNIKFDKNVILSECYRLKLEEAIERINLCEEFCTMNEGKYKMRQTKSPKLTELYKFLYPNEQWVQKHDAKDDAQICLKCYEKLDSTS